MEEKRFPGKLKAISLQCDVKLLCSNMESTHVIISHDNYEDQDWRKLSTLSCSIFVPVPCFMQKR